MFIFKNSKRDHYLRKRRRDTHNTNDDSRHLEAVSEFINEHKAAFAAVVFIALVNSRNKVNEDAVRNAMSQGEVEDASVLTPEQYGGIFQQMTTAFSRPDIRQSYEDGAQQGINLVHLDISVGRVPSNGGSGDGPGAAVPNLNSPEIPRFAPIFDYQRSYNEWTQMHTGELIRQIDNGQRNIVKQIINDNLQNERSYQTAAAQIRQHIGLTSRQSEAVTRYRNRRAAELLRDNPTMRPSTAERRARKDAERYADSLRRYRANNIARTELAKAQMNAALEYIHWGQENGFFGAMHGEWVVSGNAHVCPDCQDLDGHIIDLEHDPLPPLHPQCACGIRFIEGEAESTFPEKYREKYLDD